MCVIMDNKKIIIYCNVSHSIMIGFIQWRWSNLKFSGKKLVPTDRVYVHFLDSNLKPVEFT